jgi:hypothetical protein
MPQGLAITPRLGQSFSLGLNTYGFRTGSTSPTAGWFTCLRHLFTPPKRFRNVDRMSITYALRPRLRPD